MNGVRWFGCVFLVLSGGPAPRAHSRNISGDLSDTHGLAPRRGGAADLYICDEENIPRKHCEKRCEYTKNFVCARNGAAIAVVSGAGSAATVLLLAPELTVSKICAAGFIAASLVGGIYVQYCEEQAFDCKENCDHDHPNCIRRI